MACADVAVDPTGVSQEVLAGEQPIELLLFDVRAAEFVRTKPRWRSCLMLLWRSVTAILLQVAWAVRVLLVPALCIFGTGMVVSSDTNAMDIVLNSVAIAFM
jgi:hypothetical protein